MKAPPQSLAIFDVDGTLIKMDRRTDDETFARALKIELGIDVSTDWSVYRNATDSGIVREVLEKHLSRPARNEEIENIKQRFLTLMRESYNRGRLKCVPNPGGDTIFDHLLNTGRWAVAIATGNWFISARLKLENAGIPHLGMPIASADDGEARHEIIRSAIQRARAHYFTDEFAPVVYIGDRPWDLEAAREAGIEFIGIASDQGVEALRTAGHSGDVHPNLENAALLQSLSALTT